MNRHNLLSIVPLLAAALFTVTGAGLADEKDNPGKDTAHHGIPAHFMECARACDDCTRMCDACGTHCAKLIAQGKKEHLHTLQTCQDCATFCSAASCITARGGPFADLICQSCADACKRCGDACEKHSDDETMRKCAEECRKCEKACREMLKHVGQHREPK